MVKGMVGGDGCGMNGTIVGEWLVGNMLGRRFAGALVRI